MAQRAIKSFVPMGSRIAIKRDQAYPDDHPAVREYPQMFLPVDAVERATAAPGETRTLSSSTRRKREAARARVEGKDDDE